MFIRGEGRRSFSWRGFRNLVLEAAFWLLVVYLAAEGIAGMVLGAFW